MCNWPALDVWSGVGIVNSVSVVRQLGGMKVERSGPTGACE